VLGSANAIRMCPFSVLAGKGMGMGKEGGGEGRRGRRGNYQVVISRGTIMSLFNTSTVKLTDNMRSEWSRPTRIWEKSCVITLISFHQHSAFQAILCKGKTDLDKCEAPKEKTSDNSPTALP